MSCLGVDNSVHIFVDLSTVGLGELWTIGCGCARSLRGVLLVALRKLGCRIIVAGRATNYHFKVWMKNTIYVVGHWQGFSWEVAQVEPKFRHKRALLLLEVKTL